MSLDVETRRIDNFGRERTEQHEVVTQGIKLDSLVIKMEQSLLA